MASFSMAMGIMVVSPIKPILLEGVFAALVGLLATGHGPFSDEINNW
jgi:hypothetical protein